MPDKKRCPWAQSELERAYHDHEWGMPQHDDQKLFELLILEGMQAGLSWSLILNRRTHMRQVFDGFDPEKVARYDDAKKQALLQDAGIIRNRAKINALVGNAQAFLQVQREYGSFDAYIWAFVNGTPVQNAWQTAEEVPPFDAVATQMSKALKKQGFRFVGPTICYAFMQAAGLVNDHLVSCDFYHSPAEKSLPTAKHPPEGG